MKRSIGVREIAYFLYSSGDLSSDFFSNARALDGKKAHDYLQKRYNAESKKEYFITKIIEDCDDSLELSGFIDGVLYDDGRIILEEIKSTRLSLDDINLDYHQEHLAQLKLYGYMYGDISMLDTVNLRLTYINIATYNTKSFDLSISLSELESFFYLSVNKYLDWLNILEEKGKERIESIKGIKFPYDNLRDGQKEMIKAAYYALTHKDILYSIAPTGIGKTMASMFAGLKSMKAQNDKLFYLTCKTTGKDIAISSAKILIDKGLKIKALALTSKSKMCLNNSKRCDPDVCPYAKGFFNRLKTAFLDIYNDNFMFDDRLILEYSKLHKICPFEFSLYISEYCDLIICDYNYVFDPNAHLIRYFDDNKYKPRLLIDEAHNLVSRAKDMYSSDLNIKDIEHICKIMLEYDKTIFKVYESIKSIINKYSELLNEENEYYSIMLDIGLYNLLYSLKSRCDDIFSKYQSMENRVEALEWYFNIKDFLDAADFYSDAHRFMIKKENDSYIMSIKCLDAKEFTYDIIKNCVYGTVFFSATMYPIEYYMDLLTKGEGRYLTLDSPFNPDNLKVIINDRISTKYKDRERTILDIVKAVEDAVSVSSGNYIVFFPSYIYLELFLYNIDASKYNLVIQRRDMTDADKFNMFEIFKDTSKPHLGLFVLGGSFSEGMDFIGDILKGVIIVGVGIPQVNLVNNLLKDYFEDEFNMGYDYAYTYPGFNKVIQAVGRVIRSESDRGIALLIDERYQYNKYRQLMPKHWKNITNKANIKKEIKDFFGEE